MYPPFPEDAHLTDLERQLAPPVRPVQRVAPGGDPRQLPLWLRVGLIAGAVVLLLVGVAGLFLPGLQGVVTILAAVALLSLVSTRADRLLRWSLGPWPKILARVERLRERSHTWLVRLATRLRRRECAPSGGTGESLRPETVVERGSG